MATESPSRWGLARPALAVVLLTMAAGQLSNFAGFVDILASYRIGGRTAALLTATVLPSGELVAAVGLLSGNMSRRHRAGMVAVAVAVAWTVLAAQAFARGLALENCGCFGVHAGQRLRWWVLIEDAWLVALAWWVRRSTAGPAADRSSPDVRGRERPVNAASGARTTPR